MAYLVEAYLDPEADAAVRHLWHVLNDAGVSDSNLRNDSRPHLTLLTVADIDPEALLLALVDVARRSAFPLPLRGLGLFPGGHVTLYLPPVPSVELLDLQRACADAVVASGGEIAPRDAPGRWSPHVSLARRLHPRSLPRGFGVLGEENLSIEAKVVKIGLLRDRPIVDLGFFDLGV